MTDDSHTQPTALQQLDDAPAHLALAGPRTNGAHGNNRLRTLEHRRPRTQQQKIGSGGVGNGGAMHDVVVRHIAVRKNHLPHRQMLDQLV